MQRRTALTILTGSAVGPGFANAPARDPAHVHAASKPEQPGELLFFSDQENALLDRLADMIIPADSRSGGAHDAKVSRDIDHVVAYSAASVQDYWRAQLKAVDEEAKRRLGKTFLQCDAAAQDTLMAEWAKNEKAPKTDLERFFVRLKQSTAAGYYTSEIGVLKELGYKGSTVLKEFPGCKQPCKICSL
jgi:gluconate 2-dehydrogenase gamma chain